MSANAFGKNVSLAARIPCSRDATTTIVEMAEGKEKAHRKRTLTFLHELSRHIVELDVIASTACRRPKVSARKAVPMRTGLSSKRRETPRSKTLR